MNDSSVAIGTLRIDGTRGYPPEVAARRIESLLAAASWSDLGLPPNSILCIRKLLDPLPHVLPLDGRAIHPPQRWQIALARELNRIARNAAHAARGTVPADAEAVLFEDKAQLLACFVADFLEGVHRLRWWWPSLMDHHALARPLDGVVRRWFEEPTLLPGTIAHLGANQRLRLGALLDENVARELLPVLSLHLGLSPWVDLAEQRKTPMPSDSTSPMPSDSTSPMPSDGTSPMPSDGMSPTFIVEAATPERLSTVLQPVTREGSPLDPGFLGADKTFPAAGDWYAEGKGMGVQFEPVAIAPEIPPGKPDLPSTSRRAAEPLSMAPGKPPAAEETLRHPWRGLLSEAEAGGLAPWSEALLGVSLCAARAPVRLRDPTWKREVNRRLTGRLGIAAATDELPEEVQQYRAEEPRAEVPASLPGMRLVSGTSVAGPLLLARSSRGADAWTLNSRELERYLPVAVGQYQVRTALAGLFYLVNVALCLDLYVDFTRPMENGLPLPIWDFVDLVGHALLGAEQFADDPLWGLLADLTGRSCDTTVRSGFVPPLDWAVPLSWLAQLPIEPSGEASYCYTGQRLLVAHPMGFVMLDVAVAPERARTLTAELERELEPCGLTLVATDCVHGPCLLNEDPLSRWVARVAEYIRCRLRIALGLGEDQPVVPVLCAQPGVVVVTTTHVDILFSLAELPIAIRVAGLDRDPGFVPSAGRSIRFFYQ